MAATGAKIIDMKTDLSEFDKLVDQIHGSPYEQKENVYTNTTKEVFISIVNYMFCE